MNLDLWTYQKWQSEYYLGSFESVSKSCYDNNRIVDGKIQDKIPMYIIEDGVMDTVRSISFYNCTNLVEAPKLPSSVLVIKYVFSGCTNLIGTLKININSITSSNLNYCLENAATGEDCNLVLVGNGTNDDIINQIFATKSENSKVTIQN